MPETAPAPRLFIGSRVTYHGSITAPAWHLDADPDEFATIWHVEEALTDPSELSDLCEQHTVDAEDAFGSVEIVYAASPEAAAKQARREASETSERIHRELTRP
ncbi:hypothetical protein [Streptomyces mirabilis]|uniref:hypothetical protein n=1 Tax=Streptomyces mirabilis TaxID=68239 RepID=UPI0033A95394